MTNERTLLNTPAETKPRQARLAGLAGLALFAALAGLALVSNSGLSGNVVKQITAPAADIAYNASADRSKVTPAMQAKKDELAQIEASYATIPSHTPEYSASRDHYAKVKKELAELSEARAIELGQINAARFKHLQEVGEAAKAAKQGAHDAKIAELNHQAHVREAKTASNKQHQIEYVAEKHKKACEVYATQQGYIAAGKMDPATAMAPPQPPCDGSAPAAPAPLTAVAPAVEAPPMDGEAPPPMDGEAPPPMDGEAPPPMDGEAPPPMDGEAPPPMDGEAPPPSEDETLKAAEAAMAETNDASKK